MRVLWFSNTPANGDEYLRKELEGTGGWLKSLDRALQEVVELHVIFYHKTKLKEFQYGRTYYYPIPMDLNRILRLKRIMFNSLPTNENLAVYLNLIDRIRPDVIHIHGTENPFGCIIGKTDLPVAISIQGNITVYLHKYCSGIERKYLNHKKRNFLKLSNILLPRSFEKTRDRFVLMQKREEKCLNKCKYIIGRTSWDRRISRILAPDSIYFHSDEILSDDFYSVKWRPFRDRQKFIIHTTNSNNFYKGFETLCLCLHELNKIGIDLEWRVAGINSDDLIVNIVKRMLRDKFPKTNLVLLGRLTADVLINKLLEADLYVMPSHIENSPNSLCEAMLLGMPCIATFAGGTGSLLKDNNEGILVQDGDPWAMAGAVLELKQNPDKAVLMGGNAFKAAMKRHDSNQIVSGLLAIYTQILNLESRPE